jgi:hypothetical protein
LSRSTALGTELVRREPLVPAESEEELAKAQALARLDRVEIALQAGVAAGWLGAGLILGALSDFIFAYGHLTGMLIMAGTFSGLLAPLAVTGVRRVKEWVQHERLRLDRVYGDDLGHLSARIREVVIDTRVVLSTLQGRAGTSTVARSLWDWTRRLEQLPEHERDWLAALGLSPAPVTELLFTDDGGGPDDRVRATLTVSERRRLVRELEHFDATIVGTHGTPYR